MGISFENALGVHEQAVRLRTQRASVLANNLVNADTPNFKARDIDFQAALRSKMGGGPSSGGLRTTSTGHMSLSGIQGENETLYRLPNQPSIDGNTVDEQSEHAEYMKNNMEFQATFTFLNGKFKGLTKAVRGD